MSRIDDSANDCGKSQETNPEKGILRQLTSHPFYTPAPYQDSVDHGGAILRDGSTALIRLARPNDWQALLHFSDGCHWNRFTTGFFHSPNHQDRW